MQIKKIYILGIANMLRNIIKLKKVFFTRMLKKRYVSLYTTNQFKETSYICADTQETVNRFYTTSQYIHQFNNRVIKEAHNIILEVFKNHIDDGTVTSFANGYIEEIARNIEKKFYSDKDFFINKDLFRTRLFKCFDYDSILQHDLQAVYEAYINHENIEDSPYYSFLIEDVLQCIYIRGYRQDSSY